MEAVFYAASSFFKIKFVVGIGLLSVNWLFGIVYGDPPFSLALGSFLLVLASPPASAYYAADANNLVSWFMSDLYESFSWLPALTFTILKFSPCEEVFTSVAVISQAITGIILPVSDSIWGEGLNSLWAVCGSESSIVGPRLGFLFIRPIFTPPSLSVAWPWTTSWEEPLL